MKSSHLVIGIITLILLYSNFGHSQEVISPGFIITAKSDTIHGYFETQHDRKSAQKCLFSREESGNFIEFKPTEIKGYRISDGKFYVSKLISIDGKEQTVFLEFLIKGKANFYYYRDLDEHYFAENEELGQITELSAPKNPEDHGGNYMACIPKYKGQLMYLLPNWDKGDDEVDKTVLSHKSLIRLGKKYHESICTDESCIIFERPVTAVRYSPCINAGIHSVILKFGSRLQTRSFPGYSVGAELEFNRITHSDYHFSFSAGLSFLQLNHATIWNREGAYNRLIIYYKGYKYYLSDLKYSSAADPSVTELDVDLEYLGLRIPLYINYNFGKQRFKPMVSAGLSVMYSIKQPDQFNYPYFFTEYGKTFPDFYTGFQARAGFSYQIKERLNMHLLVNYDFMANLAVNIIYRLRISEPGITLGLKF